jgi:hypothetical protein
MKPASAAELTDISFSDSEGSRRARFSYCVDGFHHRVTALFHQAPDLKPAVWQACLQELAISCLVDVATASMARKINIRGFEPGLYGRDVLSSAAKALRLETVFDNNQSLRRVPVCIQATGTATSVDTGVRSSESRVLVLMGGGKDSLYTYNLLRTAGYDVECFYVTEPRRSWQQLGKVYRTLEQVVPQHRMFLNANQRGALDRRFRQNYTSQFQIGQVIAASVPYAIAQRVDILLSVWSVRRTLRCCPTGEQWLTINTKSPGSLSAR